MQTQIPLCFLYKQNSVLHEDKSDHWAFYNDFLFFKSTKLIEVNEMKPKIPIKCQVFGP